MNDCPCHIAIRLLLIGAVVNGFTGCGESHPMARVHGRVVFADGQVPQAAVRVVRLECATDTDAEVRKGATGIIKDDGTFEVFTRKPGDGVHLGKYDVTVLYCRSTTDQRPMIPVKYTKSATTPFHVIVDEDKELNLTIDPAES